MTESSEHLKSPVSCEECIFSEPTIFTDSTLHLICRRYPPRILSDQEGEPYQVKGPDVDSTEWCGEWQPKTSTIFSRRLNE